MIRFAVFIVGRLLATTTWGYKIETHADMAAKAALNSILSDTKFLQQFGIQYPIDAEQQKYANSKGSNETILNLIRDGARCTAILRISSRVRWSSVRPSRFMPTSIMAAG